MQQTRLFDDDADDATPEAASAEQASAELPLIADVAVDCPEFDALSYLVPAELADLQPGAGVEVPLQRRRMRGFVLACERRPPPVALAKMKAVGRRLPRVQLPPALLQLVHWASRYYRCSMGSFLAGVVPEPVRAGVSPRVERFVEPVVGADTSGLSKRQLQLYQQLPPETMPLAQAERFLGTTRATLKKLIAAGVCVLREGRAIQEATVTVAGDDHPLTDEQAEAVSAVAAALNAGEHDTFFLYGVTGSGKTLVYQRLAEQVIAGGRQVLVLLPEIGLTPQLAARFRQRFARVAVVHSGFTGGERALLWRRIVAGEVDLVIGTRSALFVPLPAIGLIVVDEEHDASYKQDSAPRYHGRDLAVVYGRQLGVPVVLGSATPSLETYHNVLQERYRLLQMRKRPAGGQLPRPQVVDMREECRRQGRLATISEALRQSLQRSYDAGEQAIILLNRRGWSPTVTCLGCGTVLGCPHCDISLTFHRGAEHLRCHYCSHAQPMPRTCPSCGQADLTTRGIGTERLAEELRRAVPGLRVLRLDADTVATRQGHARILAAFGERRADCLVGTQMVAKGLDFPDVTLVGIVAADQGLGVPDFRAGERTFQLIAQVAGRAGRGRQPGRVVVQAFDPSAPAIACAVAGKLRTFYQDELELRRLYGYPPGNGLLRLLWRGPDEARVQQAAEAHGAILRQAAGDLPVLGPQPAGTRYLQGQHRWHALIKGGSRQVIQRFLDAVDALGGLPRQHKVKVAIDVDPYVIS